MRFVIFASKLSGVVGCNPFQSMEQVALDILKTDHSETYIEALNRNSLIEVSPESLLGSSAPSEPLPQPTINDLITNTDANPSQVEEFATRESSGNIRVAGEIKSYIFRERGTRNEAANMSKLNIEYTKPNDTYKLKLKFSEDEVFLYGKVDGIAVDSDGQKYVIESKNRQYKLFNTVRDYERIQCIAYMKLLNVSKCLLVEHYNDTYSTQWIHLSNTEWHDIIIGINTFIIYFKRLLSDTALQDQLVIKYKS